MSHWKNTLILIATLILAQNASAWSVNTQRYICNSVVERVWGVEAVERCLTPGNRGMQVELCIRSGKSEEECNSMPTIHPAEIPDVLLNEPLVPMAQDRCIIRNVKEHVYLCEEETTARDRANYWMGLAGNPVGVDCNRIYLFCIGSAYLAESYNPFNWVKNENPDCNRILEEKTDENIARGGIWSVSQMCAFDYEHQLAGRTKSVKYIQQFGSSSETIEDIVRNLTSTGESIKPLPLETTTTTLPAPPTTVFIPPPPPTTIPVIVTTTTTMPVNKETVESESGVKSWMIIVAVLIIAAISYVGYLIKANEYAGKPSRPPRERIRSLGEIGGKEEFPGKGGDSTLGTPGKKKKKQVEEPVQELIDYKPQAGPEPLKKKGGESSIMQKRKGSKLGEAGDKG
ncbi:MAG: hypothetical protein ABIH11_08295 [Candidatus Altiarchaeota archaeon]